MTTILAGAVKITAREQHARRIDSDGRSIYGRSMFQREYYIIKKAFEEKRPKDKIIRLFDNQDEKMKLNIFPISVIEKKMNVINIADKFDIECKFYESDDDVPYPRKLSSDKTNLMVYF